MAYIQYGLNAAYDLSSALSVLKNAGDVTVSGFLYFNQALGNADSDGLIQDEFFGGVSVGWSF